MARHADLWNSSGSIDALTVQRDALRRHCEELGRDPAEIEMTASFWPVIRDSDAEASRALDRLLEHNRIGLEGRDDEAWWVGTPQRIADGMRERVALGFRTFIAEIAAPYDAETLERWIKEVRPAVEG